MTALLAVAVVASLAGCSSASSDDVANTDQPSATDSGWAGSEDLDGSADSAAPDKEASPAPAGEASQDEVIDEGSPGRPTRDGRQTDVFDRVPGKQASTCVRVGSARDIRSGGFVAGAFDEARKQFGTKAPGRARDEVRLYWVPLHAKAMGGIVIKMTEVSTGKTTTVTQKRVADTGDWKFYDTTVRISGPGTWRFLVRSGADTGCFEAEFS